VGDEKKMDLDEPVNVDMEPEDTLRLLLGGEPGESSDPAVDESSDTDEQPLTA